MASARIVIPAFTGGVSRQPASQRREDQTQEATNVLATIQRGLEKRPGSEFIGSSDTTDGSLPADNPTATDLKFIWLDRDATNRNLIILDDTVTHNAGTINLGLQVFNLSGTEGTITDVSDSQRATTYLNDLTDAAGEARAITVADTTFLLNTQKTAAVTGTLKNYLSPTNLYVGNTGGAGSYPAVNGTTWSQTEVDTRDYATLVDSILQDAPSWATNEGTGDAVVHLNTANAGYPVGDYLADSTSPPYITRIVHDGDANYDLDPTTMPFQLYRTAANTFELRDIDWKSRFSGSDDTNPPPLFVGKKIRGFTFHQNRLWFVADEAISASEAANFYNFWVGDSETSTDADRIETTISTDDINNVTWPVGFRAGIVFMTDGDAQFEGKALDNVLTPASFTLALSTAYKAKDLKPERLSSQLYFVSEKADSSQVWEYFYDENGTSNIAVDITKHAEGYLPKNIHQIEASENNDLLFFLTSNEPNSIYCNQSYWSGSEKAQNAWFKWEFDSGNEILSVKVFDDWLYMVVRRDDLLWLERVSITPPADDWDDGFYVRLDRRRELTGVYSAATGKTTWTYTGIEDSTITEAVLDGGWGDQAGLRLTCANDIVAGDTLVSISGDYSDYPCIVGRPFTMSVELSEPVNRDRNGTIIQGALQLRRLTTFHRDSGFYQIEINPEQRDPTTRTFSSFRLGSGLIANTPDIESFGRFSTPIMSSAGSTTITIKNSSPVPCSLVSAEFNASFAPGRINIAK